MIKNQGSADAQKPRRGVRGDSLAAEAAIHEARKTVDYNTISYPLEYFVDKISQQEIDDNLNWDESKQSYFIESLMLGLPALNIVFQEKNSNNWSELDSFEQLIDNKQRLMSALNFEGGNLRLSSLKQLESLNGFKFNDLIRSRQIKFRHILVRTIKVDSKSDISVWREYEQRI